MLLRRLAATLAVATGPLAVGQVAELALTAHRLAGDDLGRFAPDAPVGAGRG